MTLDLDVNGFSPDTFGATRVSFSATDQEPVRPGRVRGDQAEREAKRVPLRRRQLPGPA